MTAVAIPEPAITRDDARGLWRLDEDLVVTSRGSTLIVPAGFESDLASIPRAFWWLIAPFELSCVAPIVHDFLYEHGGQIVVHPSGLTMFTMTRTFTRAEADAFLRDLMRQEGVAGWRRWLAYTGVRLFGALAWQPLPSLTTGTPS